MWYWVNFTYVLKGILMSFHFNSSTFFVQHFFNKFASKGLIISFTEILKSSYIEKKKIFFIHYLIIKWKMYVTLMVKFKI